MLDDKVERLIMECESEVGVGPAQRTGIMHLTSIYFLSRGLECQFWGQNWHSKEFIAPSIHRFHSIRLSKVDEL